MKRIALTFVLLTTALLFLGSCREKTPEEKIEDGIEEVGDGIEDAADDVEDTMD